jgi:hypothetical protein
MKEDGDPSSFKINAPEASAIPMSTDKEQPTGSEPSFGLRVALQATESFESRRVLGPPCGLRQLNALSESLSDG